VVEELTRWDTKEKTKIHKRWNTSLVTYRVLVGEKGRDGIKQKPLIVKGCSVRRGGRRETCKGKEEEQRGE